jgi:hypothetical protein
MIPIWKHQLRAYARGGSLKRWLVMTVGMKYRLQIPRLARRHLDLLVKWVRDRIPAFRVMLAQPHQPNDQETFEALEPVPLEFVTSVQTITLRDPVGGEPGSAFAASGRHFEDTFTRVSDFPDDEADSTNTGEADFLSWV